MDHASVFIDLHVVGIHGFAADPAHLSRSYKKHVGRPFLLHKDLLTTCAEGELFGEVKSRYHGHDCVRDAKVRHSVYNKQSCRELI